MPKKSLQVKKKKKVTLVPKPSSTARKEKQIQWDETPSDKNAYRDDSETAISADDAEFLDGLSVLEEKQFKFYCYRCGQRLKVPLSWAKKSLECGQCERTIIIPPPLEEDREA